MGSLLTLFNRRNKPVINWSFTAGGLPSGMTFTRASQGSYFDSSGVLRTAAINEPRFDYNPVTGGLLGLLLESQRTNVQLNSVLSGAVVPSTIPAGWYRVAAVAGLSHEVVSVGSEYGMPYFDLHLYGTATSSGTYGFYTQSTVAAAAAVNDQFCNSFYTKLIGGSTANMVLEHALVMSDSGGSYLGGTAGQNLTSLISAQLFRATNAVTLSNASTAYVVPRIRAVVSSGAVIDITLRIYAPQLEKASAPSSLIPTTTSATTRAADNLIATSIPWFNAAQGAFATDVILRDVVSGSNSQALASFNDGTANNRIYMTAVNGTGLLRSGKTVGGVGSLFNTVNAFSSNVIQKASISFSKDGTVLSCLNGGSVASGSSSGALPATQLQFFKTEASSEIVNSGWLRRFQYWNAAKLAPFLQQVTS